MSTLDENTLRPSKIQNARKTYIILQVFLSADSSKRTGAERANICVTYHMQSVSYKLEEITLNFRPYREFFRALGIEQSRVSHNLACLLNCGFVEWEWNGKNKVYRLHPDLQPILVGIEKHLTKYAPALESCQTLESESKPIVMIAGANVRNTRRRARGRRKE